MYKENIKAGINPLWMVLLWAFVCFAIYILSGISQILFEFSDPYMITQIFLFAMTIVFGWYFMSKFVTEYEISVSSRYISIIRTTARKPQQMCTVRGKSIILVTDKKNETKRYKVRKKQSFVRAFQKGNLIYVIYEENGFHNLIKMKLSGLDAKSANDKIKKEGN